MKNKALQQLLFINAIFVFSATLLGPLYAVYISDAIGGNILDIGWAFALYMFTIGTLTYFVGTVGDSLKEKEYLLIMSYLVRAVGFALYISISSIEQLFLLQIFLGIGEALGNPSFKALYSLHLNKGKESSQWATWDMLNSIIIGFSTLSGAFLVYQFGFDTLFYSMSAISFISAVLLFLQPRKLL